MRFLGYIGYLMNGCCLQELLIYASNSVEHIVFGKKTVSCAVKGHLLVDASLNMVITSSALNVDILHLLVADRFS